MTEPLKPTGFWSYTSSDDTASRGRLSQLRRLLADELQLKIGREPQVHIFQDVAAIPHGADWHKEIHKALSDASFFIPIVTPAFLQSEMCCQEVLHFREREARLGRDDLILPLHYLSVVDVDPHRPSECHDAAVLELLRSRQWIDFRALRFRDPDSEDVALKLEALAGSIRAALRRGGVTATPIPAVPSRAESGPNRGEYEAGPPSPSVMAGASAATPADARNIAAIDATDAVVSVGEALAGTSAANPERSPPLVASGVSPSAAVAPKRSRQRPTVWALAGVVALLLVGTAAFLLERGLPIQTAQLAAPQPAEPTAPTTAKPEPAQATATSVPPAAAKQEATKEEAANQESARQEAAREEGVRQAADDAAKTCDTFAASPYDITRPAAMNGVAPGRIDTVRAIPACERTVADHPAPRLQFQLGRSYNDAGRFDDAARLYKIAADQGFAPAQYNLGSHYERGVGVRQSWTEAARLYKLAADQGFAPAQSNLGVLYASGHAVQQSWTEAAGLYKLAADHGYGPAQVNLGLLYESGHGVEQSWTEAERLYKLAADQGRAPAQIHLGWLYESGNGVQQSWTEAARLYKLAADQGDAQAQFRLGWLYERGDGVQQSWTEAARLYKLAADQGLASAQFNLGWLYESGHGVQQAPTEVVRLFKLAADQGDADAEFHLGWCYENGYGVQQSWTEAARLYKLAADQGDAQAQYSLGVLYEEGNGVQQSWTEAARLYKLAADQGDAQAQYSLGVLYDDGHGVPRSWTEAARYYKLAASQGDAQAQYSLGVLYDDGHGVQRSWTEAARYYKLAANQGNEAAQARLRSHNH